MAKEHSKRETLIVAEPNITEVPAMEAGTPAPNPTADREAKLKRIAELKAQIAAAQAELPELDEQEKSQQSELRYEAFKVRKEMEPLEAEYDRISNAYTDLLGSDGTNPDGSRKLRKIKFGTVKVNGQTETERFTDRWHAENKAKATK